VFDACQTRPMLSGPLRDVAVDLGVEPVTFVRYMDALLRQGFDLLFKSVTSLTA
jgi:hypothetical protein